MKNGFSVKHKVLFECFYFSGKVSLTMRHELSNEVPRGIYPIKCHNLPGDILQNSNYIHSSFKMQLLNTYCIFGTWLKTEKNKHPCSLAAYIPVRDKNK